ncbi:MAG: DMT family transporter [Polyangiaceae bacterium]
MSGADGAALQAADHGASRWTGYAMVAGAASSWGLWPLFLRRAESYGPIVPELESAVVLIFLTVLSGLAMLRDRSTRRADGKAWAGVVWLGVSDALNVVFFFRAIQTTTVAVAVLSHYLTPVLVALGAPLVLGERVSARTFGAVAMSLLGLVLLLGPWREGGASSSLVLGAAYGAASAVFTRRTSSRTSASRACSPAQLSFYHGLVAVPVVVALVPRGVWSAVAPPAWTLLALRSESVRARSQASSSCGAFAACRPRTPRRSHSSSRSSP